VSIYVKCMFSIKHLRWDCTLGELIEGLCLESWLICVHKASTSDIKMCDEKPSAVGGSWVRR